LEEGKRRKRIKRRGRKEGEREEHSQKRWRVAVQESYNQLGSYQQEGGGGVRQKEPREHRF